MHTSANVTQKRPAKPKATKKALAAEAEETEKTRPSRIKMLVLPRKKTEFTG